MNTVGKSVKDLEKEITCAICHDHYTEPKVLPCLHYYCKKCVHRLTLKTGADGPFSCPECRSDISLPQGKVEKLPTAFFVNRMKSVYSKLERAHGKVRAKCEMCSVGYRAKAFCRQCTHFICDECVKQHHRMKTFTGHKIASLDQLKEGAKEIVLEDELPFQICEKHDEAMKVYCFDCKCLICRDCTIKDHLGHNYEFIKKSAPEMKKKLIEQLNPLKEVKMDLSNAVEEIQTTKHEIEVLGNSVAKDINNSFNELQKIIENRRQELLMEAASKMAQKLEHLTNQEESLSAARSVVQSIIEYTEQCVDHSTDGEIMCMHDDIETRIEKEIEENCKEKRDLNPVEDVDVGVQVDCVEDLKKLCRAKIQLTRLPIAPAQFTIIGEGTKSAEIGRVGEFTIAPKMINGKRTRQECTIECYLKSEVKESIVKCNVSRRSRGSVYHVSYTPTVHGHHELGINVNGQKIASFPVFVFIHSNYNASQLQSSPVLTCRPQSFSHNQSGPSNGEQCSARKHNSLERGFQKK